MQPNTENKIILIVRRTRLDELIRRFNTEAQARFYVEHLGADFSDYQQENEVYKTAIKNAERILTAHGRLQVLERDFLPNFIFGPRDTVVVLGQDGLVANVLKYLDEQLVVGVNPDPARLEGVLLPFTVPSLGSLLPEVFSMKREVKTVSMAEASLNNGEEICGVNDLFIGPRSHTSARYTIESGGMSERHSSSGIIVSTGLGSTGWLRSVLAGATGITSACLGRSFPPQEPAFDWDADFLRFSVREPWPSKTTGCNITFGTITKQQPLIITSHMAENGVIFSDGIENDFLEFNAGMTATISLADKQGHLVV